MRWKKFLNCAYFLFFGSYIIGNMVFDFPDVYDRIAGIVAFGLLTIIEVCNFFDKKK